MIKKTMSAALLLLGASISYTHSSPADFDFGFSNSTEENSNGCRMWTYEPNSTAPDGNIAYGFKYNDVYATIEETAEIKTERLSRGAMDCNKYNNSSRFFEGEYLWSNNFKIIADLELPIHWDKLPQKPFVLISNEVCAKNPTLVFLSNDFLRSYYRKKNDRVPVHISTYFSNRFYRSDNASPSTIYDLEFGYTDIFTLGLHNHITIISDDSTVVMPHQFYASANANVPIPKTERDFRRNELPYGPNAVEIGLFYSLRAIQQQCKKAPESVSVKGVVITNNHNFRDKRKLNWRQFFSGEIDLTASNPVLIPDPEYRPIGEILSNYYVRLDETMESDAERDRRMIRDNELRSSTTFILSSIFLIGAMYVNEDRIEHCQELKDSGMNDFLEECP